MSSTWWSRHLDAVVTGIITLLVGCLMAAGGVLWSMNSIVSRMDARLEETERRMNAFANALPSDLRIKVAEEHLHQNFDIALIQFNESLDGGDHLVLLLDFDRQRNEIWKFNSSESNSKVLSAAITGEFVANASAVSYRFSDFERARAQVGAGTPLLPNYVVTNASLMANGEPETIRNAFRQIGGATVRVVQKDGVSGSYENAVQAAIENPPTIAPK